VSAINDELGPGASARDGALRYLDRAGLAGKQRRVAEYLLKFVLQSTDAHDWRGISLDYLADFETAYTGIGQGQFPVGGYRRLVSAMAGPADVRLKHRVVRIEADRSGAEVTAVDLARGRRRRFRGSHALVTLPLGVLKARDVAFEPGLPRARRAAIDRLGYGRFEKVALVFDEPFWEDGLSTHIFHAAANGDQSFPLYLDLQRIIGKPALVAFYNSTFAASVERSSEREIADQAIATLAKALGRQVPRPAGADITRWRRDRFSRGAYSTIAVGSTFGDLDRLAEPHHGRILFAGEATSRARFGYADGAMSTGIREAKRLLRVPAVTLTAY
jgi:monoamine oxidase